MRSGLIPTHYLVGAGAEHFHAGQSNRLHANFYSACRSATITTAPIVRFDASDSYGARF